MGRPFLTHAITKDSALGGSVIERSLRFNDNDSPYLVRTPSSAGNRRKYTISVWAKIIDNGTYSAIIGAGGGSNRDRLQIFDDDRIVFNLNDGTDAQLKTNRRLRDENSWFHLVAAVDTTQGTASNRIKLYVNGELQTSLATANYPSQNYDCRLNNNIATYIGQSSSNNYYHDGYLAEFYFIDGFQLDSSYFGCTDFQTGTWRPKGYFGSYGTNGYHLEFKVLGESATTMGLDTSGNGNNFTPHNLEVSDFTLDTPSNNFATWKLTTAPVSGYHQQEGNLEVTTGTTGNGGALARTPISSYAVNSGKWYNETWNINTYMMASVIPVQSLVPTANDNTRKIMLFSSNGQKYLCTNSASATNSTYAASYTNGDVIGTLIDMDVSPPVVYYSKNGQWANGSGSWNQSNPYTSGGAIAMDQSFFTTDQDVNFQGYVTFGYSSAGGGTSAQWISNFGQDSTFGGRTGRGVYKDSFGIGEFKYPVPDGALALCSDNLSKIANRDRTTTVIKPREHFDTLLYTGNDSTNIITGLNFNPDLVWIKNRSNAAHNLLMDTVRGLYNLRSNVNNAESSNGSNHIQTYDSNGFTLAGSGGNSNDNGDNYVAWCWKGGSPTPATSGSVTFDGANGTNLRIANSADIQLGSTSNWTIEFWLKRTGAYVDWDVIVGKGAGGTYEWFIEGFADGSVDFLYSNNGSTTWSGQHEIISSQALDRWYHIAIVRNGSGANNFKMYVDGIQTFQTTAFDIYAGTYGLDIGGYGGAAGQDPPVVISNLRIVKGTSVYTSNFTPPTSPLTNITNTKLLCCQSSTSATAATVTPNSITVNGSCTPQSINPFDAFSKDGVGYSSTSAAKIVEGTIPVTGASVNKKAGFSIVTFTGTGSAGTVGHGLGKAPSFVITKRRNAAQDWFTHHKGIANGHYLRLNNTNQQGGDTNVYPNNMSTANTFAVGGDDGVNGNGSTYVSYCWAEIPGYSAFGRYKGNGQSNGRIIYTGFRPAMVMLKQYDGINENWSMSDNTRSPFNPVNLFLRPDETTQDTSGAAQMDFVSDGFRLRNSDDKTNRNGSNYVYMAWAEQTYNPTYYSDPNAR